MKSPKDPSVVGLRSSWTCAICKAVERSYQLVFLANPQELSLPAGWRIIDGLSVCGTHDIDVAPQEEQPA